MKYMGHLSLLLSWVYGILTIGQVFCSIKACLVNLNFKTNRLTISSIKLNTALFNFSVMTELVVAPSKTLKPSYKPF